ncbi:MAG TPA: phosphoribosylamine--glycine ligase [Gammaproteobacteria bacterium]|jgi:phosphoribosylamine--glycine ligase|nr:phosphoribosylamine--glycine ligase [Acidiferrobacteraceae bacterium]MDP6552146.1 phosphoribosylamine--glycine ligase [Arenicellales bacterium]MDP6792200.1 phosphoribosylamine--glycine ligase [Arenicellales bacterium]MDP6919984.1 phosphoribosylamine--glycine ligase [Arenicellales bacterium]HCX88848.1 phosphoribosylamine--glycine ligase [Gammaproteobacteria bacterium]|tara:strand:+ start:1211 stop:2488 length:1278 start_codon:yes stop_codon:yes gene_type:complete
MRVLVIGNGGREHALAWKLAGSGHVDRVFVAPGNAGTSAEPGVENLPIPANDTDALIGAAQAHQIDLTVVGPEAPLVNGIVDRFEDAGLPCFGPRAGPAQLEGSKSFTKAFLDRHRIPTASWQAFTDPDAARQYIESRDVPMVLKADGLAAGKGVIIAKDHGQALAAADEILVDQRFGAAGRRLVIEDFLEGEEISFICVASGTQVLPLATSQDHKAREAGDRGPNTGGMGAYSPAPRVDAELHQRIMDEVIHPTVHGLVQERIPYLGFLYAGLMIDAQGNPRVLEYNCRFGDPETQPILMRLRSDLAGLCQAALDGKLDQYTIDWDPRFALGVVMVAAGYPGEYPRGDKISGLQEVRSDNIKVFHAGTRQEAGQVITDGGRVLCVTALGATVDTAQQEAYSAVGAIHWRGADWRPDIGWRALNR